MRRRDDRGRILLASVEQARELDRLTIESYGLPGDLLMELAGSQTARIIGDLFGERTGRATILCGGGNNGGDGYVIARHLLNCGWEPLVLSTVDVTDLKGDARRNFTRFMDCGGECTQVLEKVTGRVRNRLKHSAVIVDALLGMGLTRSVEGGMAALIKEANAASHGFRVAVDVPSGIDADSGNSLGTTFHAHHTVTFGLEKPGLWLGQGRECAGRVHRCDIGIPTRALDEFSLLQGRLDEQGASALLPVRSADGHKGSYGHVGVLGGFEGKEGAAILASLGALYGAAGLVTWMGVGAFDSVERPPEIMTRRLELQGIEPRASVFVLGPGLGQSAQAVEALSSALSSAKPCVIDADALTLIARGDVPCAGGDYVMTPHPAEAARLLHIATGDVLADFCGAAARLASRYGVTVLLKGAQSVVAEPNGYCTIVHEGDPTLSAGGTGDVLAGLVAAYLAQGLGPGDAAMLGAFVHGRAAAAHGALTAQRGVLASEVASAIPEAVGQLRLAWQV